MKKLLFNNTAHHKDRQNVKKLPLSEENEVIRILNDALHFHSDKQKELVQKFIYHYENMNHFKSTYSKDWLKYNQ